MTCLFSTRDASYTTQPLELLNDLDLENSRHSSLLTRNLELNSGDQPSGISRDSGVLDANLHTSIDNGHVADDGAAQSPTVAGRMGHNQGPGRPTELEGSEGC